MSARAWTVASRLMMAGLVLLPIASVRAESVLAAPSSTSVSYAGAFLATQSFRVQSVVFPGVFQQSPSSFDLAIYGSAQGMPSSSLGSVSNLTGGTTVVNLSSLALSVAAGQTYWLVLSSNGVTAANTSVNGTSAVPLSVMADSTTGVVSAVVSAVNEIPEPSTATLALVALAGFGLARRVRTR